MTTELTQAQRHEAVVEELDCLCSSIEADYSREEISEIIARHVDAEIARLQQQVQELVEALETALRALRELGACEDEECSEGCATYRVKDALATSTSASTAVKSAQMRLLFDYCREGKRPENSEELLKQYIKEEMEKAK